MVPTSVQSTHESSTIYPSPVGDLLLIRNENALTGIYFQSDFSDPSNKKADCDEAPNSAYDTEPFGELKQQLDEYFAGKRRVFELSRLALQPSGTAFQKRVWNALLQIPYGETISYGELARWIEQPNASRAVGLANGRNPISIIIPCHRVIGSNGKLVGYGGGLDRKKLLLEIESPAVQLF